MTELDLARAQMAMLFAFHILFAEAGMGILVALAGILSGVFVVAANAWMNSPAGFSVVAGKPAGVSPLAAMANPAWWTEAIHMTLAAFAASGFAVAGIHAFRLLREPRNAFHRAALGIALSVGGAAAAPRCGSGGCRTRRRKLPAMP